MTHLGSSDYHPALCWPGRPPSPSHLPRLIHNLKPFLDPFRDGGLHTHPNSFQWETFCEVFGSMLAGKVIWLAHSSSIKLWHCHLYSVEFWNFILHTLYNVSHSACRGGGGGSHLLVMSRWQTACTANFHPRFTIPKETHFVSTLFQTSLVFEMDFSQTLYETTFSLFLSNNCIYY